jgi:hypothetical protein
VLPGQIEALCHAQLIKHFDAHIVGSITKEPGRCTFQRAGEWNSVITVVEAEGSGQLQLFREAATVLMMGMALCAEPPLSAELAPHLPPALVCSLLAHQIPDDFNPMPNDLALFTKHYKLADPKKGEAIKVAYEGDFEGIWQFLASDWRNVAVKGEVAQQFDFLKQFLAFKE